VISEWFITIGIGFAGWVVGLFPEWDVPSEVAGFDDMLNGFIAPFSSLGAWVPWTVIFICVGLAVAAWVIGWGVKAIRAVAAHVPFVGGAG
jgi:hypothetical protein